MRDSKSRTKSQALAVYLFWLKTGLGQATIAAFFDNEDLNQQNISHFSEQIRTALSISFVPNNLVANSLAREKICEHNTPFVNVFCENPSNQKVALIADGTYLRCEKSSNHSFQRFAYIGQKNAILSNHF